MKTIGIIGGMGPLATHDFYRKLIELTPAVEDAQHIPVVMVANTLIPNRIAAWEGRGPSPLPALITAARQCVEAGARVLAMPCNTAHFWFDDMALAVPQARFLHIADEALRACPSSGQAPIKLALTGTHATVAMGLYQSAAARLGMAVQWLDVAAVQADVTAAIASVKAGRIEQAAAEYQRALAVLQSAGAQAVVMGCTELPVISGAVHCELPLIDATDALARACIAACLDARTRTGHP
jgi:aspartate racemase